MTKEGSGEEDYRTNQPGAISFHVCGLGIMHQEADWGVMG